MSWGSPVSVIAIIALCYAGWLLNNWIRARHGYPVEGEFGGLSHKSDGPDTARAIELLVTENERQKGQILRLEERVAVLERIATDTGTRLTAEIDRLR